MSRLLSVHFDVLQMHGPTMVVSENGYVSLRLAGSMRCSADEGYTHEFSSEPLQGLVVYAPATRTSELQEIHFENHHIQT